MCKPPIERHKSEMLAGTIYIITEHDFLEKYAEPQVTKAYYKSLYGFEIELKISYFSFKKLQ